LKRKIGRIDKADFPELNLFDIDIKIDTGAYTSSIHCKNLIVEDNYLKCVFLDEEHPAYHEKQFVFDRYDVKVVKSSNGISQARYRVLTEIVLFGKTYPIFLTLSDREEMRYPVLIGRKFLTNRFVVDINKTNLSYKLKLKQKHEH
tara:strand:+ start:92601 stop:93038 length:438 start_codon:yes stop_codon:yes gene_type:complete